MTKKYHYMILVSGLFTTLGYADVKHSGYNFDNPIVQNNSAVQAATSGNRVAEFNRQKQLRCWQKGQLIVTESGWDPSDKDNSAMSFRKGPQTMSLFEFGETFCIYTGEK